MLYFSQVNEKDDVLEELDSAELIKQKQFNKDFCILLIGVEQVGFHKNSHNLLYINPTNYVIRNGDIGYFVAQSREKAIKRLNRISNRGVGLQKFELITEQYDKTSFMENGPRLVTMLYENLISKNKDWQQNIPLNNNKKDNVFDLNAGDSIRGFFINHIIIKGSLLDFKSLLTILRFYSEQPVLIFSDETVDFSKWTKIKDSFTNVYYVRGIQLSLNHISELDPRNASKILIMSQSKDTLFLDTDTVFFARILKDFFNVRKYLIELCDETMIRFLEIRPRYNLQKNNDLTFFWPSFVSGNAHYNSLLVSMVARSLYNPNWIFFFKAITNPKVYLEKDLFNNKVVKENSNLCTLKITRFLARQVIIFGKLQYLLMNNDPCIIALALIKKRKNEKKSKFATQIMESLKKTQTSLKLSQMSSNIIKTIDSIYGTNFFLTNPTYFTKLNAGDKVLVLGMSSLQLKINDNRKTESQVIEKILKRNIFLSKSQKKKVLVPIANIKKHNAEIEFKSRFKSQAAEIVKGLNDTLRKSVECMEILNKRETSWKNQQDYNKYKF